MHIYKILPSKFYIFTIILLTIGFTAAGQKHNLKMLDKVLASSFTEMVNNRYSANYDSLTLRFKKYLKEALTSHGSLNYPFEKFSNKVHVVTSSDRKMKIYSWDNRSGGTWHDMDAFAQFITTNGQIHLQQLDSDREPMTGKYTDAIIYKIYTLIIEGRPHYLTLGRGTHGSGHHHEIVQIFRIKDNKLLRCKECFKNQKNLVVVAPRSEKINLRYHPHKQIISHNEFTYDKKIGFYQPTGRTLKWILEGGIFKNKSHP